MGVHAALREVMVERAPQVFVGGVEVGGAGRGGVKGEYKLVQVSLNMI